MRFTTDICENDAHYLYPILLGENYKSLGDCSVEECIDKLGQYEDIDENPSNLEKIKKAFEIIKEKKVDTDSLFAIWDMKNIDDEECLKLYNNPRTIYGKPKLTQEEYDLLKEVL